MKLLPVLILIFVLIFGCDSLKGPTGPEGLPGIKGDTGETGIQGEKGNTGETGDPGSQGEQGETGETGEPGPEGIQGETGEAIYTEIAVDEEKGTLIISDATWSYEIGLFSEGPLVVTGLAKNSGTTVLDWVEIHIKAYDSTDKIISADSDYLYSYQLNPGQESWWKVTDYYCDKEPSKVTCGYSFDTTVIVPAPKISAGGKPD